MLATLVSLHLPSALADAAMLTCIVSILNALVRLVLCALTAYATVKALKEPSTDRDMKVELLHRQAVLQALLGAITHRRPGREPGQ